MTKLRKIIENAAGIDIGSQKVFVAIEEAQVKSFETFTSSYNELVKYLREHHITHVAMEATGVYWITLYDILEQSGFDVYLVNPADSKNLPGRKTDVQDCQWIKELFSMGLLRKSFVPKDFIRELRCYTRLREDKIQTAAMHINHMQKAMTLMNIRLPEVLSQIHGSSGMAMIEAILKGERDENKLLLLCHTSLKKSKSEKIIEALKGNYKQEYLFELQIAYDGYMFYQNQIATCDKKIEILLKQVAQDKEYDKQKIKEHRIKPIRHNKPMVLDLHENLLKLNNVNATSLPGITDYTFLRLTAELGTDLSQWPSEKNFTSWLGLSPGKHQSGKINKRSKKKSVTRAGQIFKQAAQTILLSKNIALGDFARRLRAKRGPAIAIKATARKLAELYYKLFMKGLAYVEHGLKFYQDKQRAKLMHFLKKKAQELNLQLVEN
ncbi:MAG: IS110 family transposase [Pseudomonadota bacterium]